MIYLQPNKYQLSGLNTKNNPTHKVYLQLGFPNLQGFPPFAHPRLCLVTPADLREKLLFPVGSQRKWQAGSVFWSNSSSTEKTLVCFLFWRGGCVEKIIQMKHGWKSIKKYHVRVVIHLMEKPVTSLQTSPKTWCCPMPTPINVWLNENFACCNKLNWCWVVHGAQYDSPNHV